MRLKAIVLTWDRHRVMTQHMIRQYARLWPDHPFLFRVPFQVDEGAAVAREEYRRTPPQIPETILTLIEDLPDEEWIYWCADDKYPIDLRTEQIAAAFAAIEGLADAAGLLCCRCRVTLDDPALSLVPGERKLTSGDIILERRQWFQIWIHQFLRVKVLRHFFTHMPRDIPNAKVMDELKNEIPKPENLKLYVTHKNHAIFGESTQGGQVTQNCYESIRTTDLVLPPWFQTPTSDYVVMGELTSTSLWSKLRSKF